jgi:pyruvate dehydrogenase E2 component (dihydrolipoamide acetyltransferase)
LTKPSPRADIALAETLHRFEDHFLATTDGTAGVAVSVARQHRFTNIATAGAMTLRLDEPIDFGGSGLSMDPAETLLAAVGASLLVTVTAHAALRSLAIADVSATLRARLDGRSFFHPREHPRAGLLKTEIELLIVSEEDARDLRALFAEACRACPVLKSLKRSPRIELTLRTTDAPC